MKGRHAGKIGYHDDDEADHAVFYFAEPIRSGYVLTKRNHLANAASLEHKRWITAMSCARPCVAYRVETMSQADQRALFDGVEVVDETPRHALLCVIGGKQVWVTLGNRRSGTEVQKRGDRGTLVVSKAFAIRNGLWENVSTLPAMNLRRSPSSVSLSPARPAPALPEKVLDSGHRFGQRR